MMSEAPPPTIDHHVGGRERLSLHGVAFCQQIALSPGDFVHFGADYGPCAVFPAVEPSKARASSRVSDFAIRAIARSANPERHFLANSFSSSSRLCWAGLSEVRLCWAGLSEVRSFIFWNAAAIGLTASMIGLQKVLVAGDQIATQAGFLIQHRVHCHSAVSPTRRWCGHASHGPIRLREVCRIR